MSTAISSPTALSRIPSNPQISSSSSSSSSILRLNFTNNRHGKGAAVGMLMLQKNTPRNRFRCNCSSSPGENESKEVLDAFFLGKALAEALNERIESTVGEFLSTVGRLQAEQQKQVQEFQDDVLERAKKAKEKAAREAMEAQGLVRKPTSSSIISSSTANKTTNGSGSESETIEEPKVSPSSSSSDSEDENPSNGSTDPILGIQIDD
ncbi:hypothetical protein OSB04_023189 [Centaurea solstitialis]|uniref:Uncharacterized protein n=1 Tax=Centaurea solstitialis TaxID=347529 RepID=A0AA38W218_9ASTR|nr:hypothetical protein OSB04_023189 [Centaurea solstitialis]